MYPVTTLLSPSSPPPPHHRDGGVTATRAISLSTLLSVINARAPQVAANIQYVNVFEAGAAAVVFVFDYTLLFWCTLARAWRRSHFHASAQSMQRRTHACFQTSSCVRC